MDDVDLTVEVSVTRDACGRDLVTDRRQRVFKVPLRRSCVAQAWRTQRFNAALGGASAGEVVKVEITGRSADASHHLAAGRMLGWFSKVQARESAFARWTWPDHTGFSDGRRGHDLERPHPRHERPFLPRPTSCETPLGGRSKADAAHAKLAGSPTRRLGRRQPAESSRDA